jgi:hypothetical protein
VQWTGDIQVFTVAGEQNAMFFLDRALPVEQNLSLEYK